MGFCGVDGVFGDVCCRKHVLRDLPLNREVEETAAAFWLGIGSLTVMAAYDESESDRLEARPPDESHLDYPIPWRCGTEVLSLISLFFLSCISRK